MVNTQDRKTDDKLLTSYLQDHVMAADSGAQLFEEARQLWAETPYAERFQSLSADIEQDRQELRVIANEIGAELSPPKKIISSVSRTLSRLNPLNLTGSHSGLSGQFEVEGLHAAVAGKECLWQTLEQLSFQDNRIDGEQQQRLIKRAEDQQNRLADLIREIGAEHFRQDTSA